MDAPASMNRNPLVTVYIPTFNRLALLRRALDSVLKQSYCELEVIVVDDRSSDGTRQAVEEVRRADPRVVLLSKPEGMPRGAPASRNLAIERACGEFVTGLDDDDYFHPERIQEFVRAWDGSASALYSDTRAVYGPGYEIVSRRPAAVRRDDLLVSNFVGSQVFAPKATYIRAGGFDTTFPMWQDLELWFAMLKDGGVMKRAGLPSYYVDAGHEETRISNQPFARIRDTHAALIRKHGLSPVQAYILESQCYLYEPARMPWRYCLGGLMFWHRPRFVHKMFKLAAARWRSRSGS